MFVLMIGLARLYWKRNPDSVTIGISPLKRSIGTNLGKEKKSGTLYLLINTKSTWVLNPSEINAEMLNTERVLPNLSCRP